MSVYRFICWIEVARDAGICGGVRTIWSGALRAGEPAGYRNRYRWSDEGSE